ncbi:MAG: ATP-binding cassette domain-containing protein, partial [Spirochaetia bacterium]
MDQSFLSFKEVSFRYPSSPDAVLEKVNADFPRGWTGIVGANGVGKTTMLLLASGMVLPSGGTVRAPGHAGGAKSAEYGGALYCAQKTDAAPELLAELLAASDGYAGELRSRLGIREEWEERWESLSHGERKRAQIAVALWRDPPVLCIDEPTNHVDSSTRELLREGLQAFRGIGLLVSHDRELLDLLCSRCFMIAPPRFTMRPGTYSQAAALEDAERQRARDEYERMRQTERGLRRKLVEKKREAAESSKRLSKRGIDRKDHDAKGRIDLARITSKDRGPARQVREIDARLVRAGATAATHAVRKDYELGLWFDSEAARRDILFDLPATRLPLGSERSLLSPPLLMQPADRIALTGPNGSGKSTLLQW